MSLRHVSPGHCLAGVSMLAILTFAGGDWNRAQARATPAHAAHPANKDAKGAAHEAREAAQCLPPGPQRDMLLKKAGQAETAQRINEWLASPAQRSTR